MRELQTQRFTCMVRTLRCPARLAESVAMVPSSKRMVQSATSAQGFPGGVHVAPVTPATVRPGLSRRAMSTSWIRRSCTTLETVRGFCGEWRRATRCAGGSSIAEPSAVITALKRSTKPHIRMTPASRAAATTTIVCARSSDTGFSTSSGLPAAITCSAMSAWVAVVLATMIASQSSASSVEVRTPETC